MKKASNIILLISAIMGFVLMGVFLISAITFAIFTSPSFSSYIIEGINNGTIHTTASSPEEAANIVRIVFTILSGVYIYLAIFSLISAIISINARNKETNNVYIACIVLGLISGNEIVLVGSILGLISNNKEQQ